MVSKGDSSSAWLNLGYQLFSEEGHEGLQVERLARILGKNKSGFYHFFGDKDVFLERLMQMHVSNEERLFPELTKLQEIDGRFIELILANKETILFQTQLVKNRDVRLFQDTFVKVNKMVEQAIGQAWVRFLGVSEAVALKYWRLIRDTFYARVTRESFHQEWVVDFVKEAKLILREAQRDSASI
ncbi:helix-turn-helix transcriptional regulator [Algoriphagus aestuariicola]|uniref:Helix-turn-helix transcriptional regulator n=1 Tax=Algoriphagus aestuariicola TaxID=1852016 RepID=A0ABS3BPQ6_9BACT|nr:helix-turn-helix domain-containing protein [Algoriphagus aestuariicola]MBN7801298.1 helix-turn-helix transcriptional regulator [Algoriphagus aestuariicola]